MTTPPQNPNPTPGPHEVPQPPQAPQQEWKGVGNDSKRMFNEAFSQNSPTTALQGDLKSATQFLFIGAGLIAVSMLVTLLGVLIPGAIWGMFGLTSLVQLGGWVMVILSLIKVYGVIGQLASKH